MNFLQAHYNDYRQAGGDHVLYVIVNDLGDEAANELRREYEKMYPKPVSENKKNKFKEDLDKETRDAQLRDDIEWLTGTGRYGQG